MEAICENQRVAHSAVWLQRVVWLVEAIESVAAKEGHVPDDVVVLCDESIAHKVLMLSMVAKDPLDMATRGFSRFPIPAGLVAVRASKGRIEERLRGRSASGVPPGLPDYQGGAGSGSDLTQIALDITEKCAEVAEARGVPVLRIDTSEKLNHTRMLEDFIQHSVMSGPASGGEMHATCRDDRI